jgi:hypothetical protein
MGLDMKKWAAALDGHKYAALVDADGRAAGALGLSSAPTFVVGDYVLRGSVPWRLRRLIERVLQEQQGRAVDARAVVSARWEPSTKAPIPPGPAGVARPGRIVTIHYVGRLTDGREVDSSRSVGRPYVFTLGAGDVIKGLDQGLVGMRVGEKRVLTVPPELAYGERGSPPMIPPSATLVYEVELLEVK